MVKIEIKESSKGLLTVLKEDCRQGEIILMIKGKEVGERGKYSIQVAENIHIFPNEESGKYINHSCNPNTKITKDRVFVALRDIKSGEEITFDYDTTEDEIAKKFTCLCGSSNCRGEVVGRKNLVRA